MFAGGHMGCHGFSALRTEPGSGCSTGSSGSLCGCVVGKLHSLVLVRVQSQGLGLAVSGCAPVSERLCHPHWGWRTWALLPTGPSERGPPSRLVHWLQLCCWSLWFVSQMCGRVGSVPVLLSWLAPLCHLPRWGDAAGIAPSLLLWVMPGANVPWVCVRLSGEGVGFVGGSVLWKESCGEHPARPMCTESSSP